MTERIIIGNAELWHGDALEVLPRIGRLVDALVTDPPYSSGGMTRGDRMQSTRNKYQSTGAQEEHPEFTGDNRDQRGFMAWATLWLVQALDITVPGGVAVLFSDWRQLPTMTDALQAGGWVWRGIVPWDKQNARPQPNRFRAQCEYALWGTNGPRDHTTEGAEYHPGLLSGQPPGKGDRVHSTQKPVGVIADLCRIAPRGGVVLDPFMGSGTTGVACLGIDRRFVGIEKDRRIFDLACKRIEAETRRGEFIERAAPEQTGMDLVSAA